MHFFIHSDLFGTFKKTMTNNTQLKRILIYARQFYNVMMATYLYGQNLKYRCFILKSQQPMHVINVVTVADVKWAKILPWILTP